MSNQSDAIEIVLANEFLRSPDIQADARRHIEALIQAYYELDRETDSKFISYRQEIDELECAAGDREIEFADELHAMELKLENQISDLNNEIDKLKAEKS